MPLFLFYSLFEWLYTIHTSSHIIRRTRSTSQLPLGSTYFTTYSTGPRAPRLSSSLLVAVYKFRILSLYFRA
ncbi:hypothetical protein EDD16DRAFT_425707 [Pisolithus croceorrhizus]|nr:hypothetical protein EDD16DRAFT_425707 [Pisolithus croceorrhizus]